VYPFLDSEQLTYPQYMDEATWSTLVAEPGNSYTMTPANGQPNLPVPPNDGWWGPPNTPDDEAETAPASDPPAEPQAAKPAARKSTGGKS
jgi:hypothetical protein